MESNHDIEMLNNSKYPFALRQRILSDKGHLSNYDSAKYISKFIGSKTKYVLLAHLSEENNTEELALETLDKRLKKEKIAIDNIIIAKQNIATSQFSNEVFKCNRCLNTLAVLTLHLSPIHFLCNAKHFWFCPQCNIFK